MGTMTRATIVSEALLTVGNSAISSRVNAAFSSWLRKTYALWSWHFLARKASGIALPAGAQSLVLGNGSGGIADEIQRISDPIWVYSSAFNSQVRARVRSWNVGSVSSDRPEILDPTTNKGTPSSFSVLNDTGALGKWTLRPNVVPDRAYLLSLDYWRMPADIPTDGTGDSAIPDYPNDDTMVLACIMFGFRYTNETNRYAEARDLLGTKVAQDRVTYSVAQGIGDVVGLDPSTFR